MKIKKGRESMQN